MFLGDRKRLQKAELYILNNQMSLEGVVIILDGNSEMDAHV